MATSTETVWRCSTCHSPIHVRGIAGTVDWRAVRLALVTPMSLRAAALALDMNPGRLSIIERGVTPTPDEERALHALYEASGPPAANG